MKKTILVVDDEQMILELLKEILNNAGYLVRCAVSGEEALKILKEESIWVCFLDLQMPEMNGVELCKKIKKISLIISVVAVTADTSTYDLVSCLKAGFDDYFKKPIDSKALLKTAEHAFARLQRWWKVDD